MQQAVIREAEKSALPITIQIAENILIKAGSEVFIDQSKDSDPEIKRLVSQAIGEIRPSDARNSYLSYALY